MYKISKHITIVLLGIFVFPILFQSIHIVWHHTRDISCETNDHKDVLSFNENHHCPICEYQFSINQQSDFFIFKSVIPVLCFFFKEPVITDPYQQSLSLISPRAPPLFSVL